MTMPIAHPPRRWNNFALNFAFPLGALIPTNGKRTADLLQSMVKSFIGHDMAQPPPKHWQSFGLPFTRYNRKRTALRSNLAAQYRTAFPNRQSHGSAPVVCGHHLSNPG